MFDTLNAKAAIFALDELMEASGERLPVIVSGTVTDASGRILSGQTVGGVLAQRAPRAAARDRPELRARRGADAALRRRAGAGRRRHLRQLLPNAGLPNPMSETGFDETPEVTAGLLEEFARAGFLNIAGGCCGTTPEHIAMIAERVGSRASPRVPNCRDLGQAEPR